MDELDLVRGALADDPAPDRAVLDRARAALAAEFDRPASTSLGNLRRGLQPVRVIRRHRRPAVALLAAVIAVLLFLELLPTTGPYSDLGLQLNSASAQVLAVPRHTYDGALEFTFVPPGFERSETTLDNTVSPLQFVLAASLHESAAASASHFEVVTAGIEQVSSSSAAASLSPGQRVLSETVQINGHLATMTVAAPESIKHPNPQAQSCGLQAKRTLNSYERVHLSWSVAPGEMLSMTGVGMSASEVLRIARGLVYDRALDDCLSGSRVISRVGACKPGISPTRELEPVPANTVLGGGTLGNTAWDVTAAVEPNYVWLYFNYGGALVGGQCIAGPDSLSPQLSLQMTATGRRFAMGILPSGVTKVEARSRTGSIVTMAVLPLEVRKASTFFVYLGQIGGVCDDLCSGTVTFTFFRGASALGAVTVTSNEGRSGFPISGHTTFHPSRVG